MKKFFALLVALVLAVTAIPLAFAADELTFSVSSITVNKGERFSMYVDVSGNQYGLLGAKLGISYPNGFTMTNITSTGNFSELSLTNSADISISPAVALFDSMDPSYDDECELVKFTMEAPDVAGNYTIGVTAEDTFDASMGAISALTVPGTVTVNDAPSRLDFKGAQVRVGSGDVEQGLRFIFTIDKSFYNELSDAGILPQKATNKGLGFGAVLFPKSYLDQAVANLPAGPAKPHLANLEKTSKNGAKKAQIVPAVKLFGEEGNAITYTACILGISESDYQTEFVAIPYATYMDGDREITIYGTQTEPISVFDIADKAYQTGTERSEVLEYLYENILVKVDASYEK